MDKRVEHLNKKQKMCNADNTESTEINEAEACYILDGKFFQVLKDDGEHVTAHCKNCPIILHGQKGSTLNFLNHIKYKHSNLVEKVNTYQMSKKGLLSTISKNGAEKYKKSIVFHSQSICKQNDSQHSTLIEKVKEYKMSKECTLSTKSTNSANHGEKSPILNSERTYKQKDSRHSTLIEKVKEYKMSKESTLSTKSTNSAIQREKSPILNSERTCKQIDSRQSTLIEKGKANKTSKEATLSNRSTNSANKREKSSILNPERICEQKYKHSTLIEKVKAYKTSNKGSLSTISTNSANKQENLPIFRYQKIFKQNDSQHSTLIEKVKEYKISKDNTLLSTNSVNKREKLPILHSESISKQKIISLVFQYFVEDMLPMTTCEKPAFKRLVMSLTGMDDATSLPDRRIMENELKLKYQKYITILTKLIEKQSFICTTADIWSCNNESYLGMTCHFIDKETYIRYSYVLGCRRILNSHTFCNIVEVMNDITQTYSISNSKISHIVIDNASNFGKTFRTYSIKTMGMKSLNVVGSSGNWFVGESYSDDNSSDTCVEIDSYTDIDTVNLSLLLSTTKDIENDEISLPDRMTCTTNTLILIATVDTKKISDNFYKKNSKDTFAKLCTFWNLISSSTVASDKVFDICNCEFPVPIMIQWNSTFNAIKKILANKDNITAAFKHLKLVKLDKIQWLFLEEYCSVFEPLALSLHKLQDEQYCYLGYVAPTIIKLRLLLKKQTNLTYCRPLALSIIKSLKTRFNFLFDLKHIKSKSYIIAAISHPYFKLSWVPDRYMTYCKSMFLSECNSLNPFPNNLVSNTTLDDNDTSDSDEEFDHVSSGSQSSSDFSLSIDNKSTDIVSVQALSYLGSRSKDLKMLDSFPIVKNVFFKYNTTLPSSEPIERLFSSGSQILTPRRNRLDDKTFEMLLCCRSLIK